MTEVPDGALLFAERLGLAYSGWEGKNDNVVCPRDIRPSGFQAKPWCSHMHTDMLGMDVEGLI